MRLHELSTALDLGDVAQVVDGSPSVNLDDVPPERAASHQIDLARALSYVARDEEAVATLLDAERKAPQLVRHSAAVRETVRTMYRRTPASSGRAEPMRLLASRCRAVE